MCGIWTTTRLFPVLTSVEYDGSLTLGGCSKLTGISFFPVFSLESCYPPAEARHKHVPLPKLQQAESPLKSSVAQSFGAPISIQSLLVGWELCPRYDRSRILGPDPSLSLILVLHRAKPWEFLPLFSIPRRMQNVFPLSVMIVICFFVEVQKLNIFPKWASKSIFSTKTYLFLQAILIAAARKFNFSTLLYQLGS